ncbi:type II toxin-antitoxin system HicB family antitoxin, partial [Candidatus Latescibacterota bacterium]
MNYPIVIHKDKNSSYGVIVPDLPGCFSSGE